MGYYSDDPVIDFELHDAQRERRAAMHFKGKCVQCREKIHDYDDHYDFEGDLVCDDCLISWARNYRVRA